MKHNNLLGIAALPIPRGVLGEKQRSKIVNRLQNDFKAAQNNYEEWCANSNSSKQLREELALAS